MTAARRVAFKISTHLLNCIFSGGTCVVGSGVGGSDLGLVVMVRYYWSSEGDVGVVMVAVVIRR